MLEVSKNHIDDKFNRIHFEKVNGTHRQEFLSL